MAEYDGGQAFPRPGYQFTHASGLSEYLAHEQGMSLRDYFAAKALQAEIITTCSDATPEAAESAQLAAGELGRSIIDHLAANAYEWADAMLRARNAGKE